MANSTTTASTANAPIVLSGPSGSGKSTLLKRLFATYPTRLGYSVSHTTRAPRPGEKDGAAYHFVTRDAFSNLLAQDAFLEHAEFNGNLYGTSFAAIEAVARQGKTCVLDIEMEGVRQLRRHPELGAKARILFLRPPSLTVLEERLRGRGTDQEADVRSRLEQAAREMEFAEADLQGQGGVFNAAVTNDVLEVAWQEVRQWVSLSLAAPEEKLDGKT